MSKIVRKQLIGTIELLKKASGMIEDSVRKNQDTIALLTDCQDLAVALGCRIEELKGMNTFIVPALEKYCELLYMTGQALCQDEDIHSHCEKVLRQIGEIKEIFTKVFPDKLEVVFLPYKASMWDSLESVWLAAKDDENCEAYVVPIPYYDKNSDGSLGERHYEGELYPDYVPVVPYGEFDLKLHHPDMVFIHNPYDGYNRVTSVHPDYYSSQLKAYTENLVYIPYFILGKIDIDNQKTINEMKHFCEVAAVINAHKVIVQSENMKKIYVKVMTAFSPIYSEEYWKEKVLGLGSPKVDRLLTRKKKKNSIPVDWMEQIIKPDGSRKKVVFYNTSITALLQNREKMLIKMKNVFDTFLKHKEEAILLWRPHPLMQTTIESMCPALWQQYAELVANYKERRWGIYDDTSEADLAMVISDAYYGDPSSLMSLYSYTGNPIWVQGLEEEAIRNIRIDFEKPAIESIDLSEKELGDKNIGKCIYDYLKEMLEEG